MESKKEEPKGKKPEEAKKHDAKDAFQKQLEEKQKTIDELTDTLKRLQAEFENYKKRVDKEKIEGFYPTSNFAWNEGIRYWLNGDEAMAMEVLGHILHLMEDMGVPEHTRNDSHVKGSKYEEYTARYDSNSPDDQLRSRIGDKKPVSLRSLDKYFDGLAKYSNKYFYFPRNIKVCRMGAY